MRKLVVVLGVLLLMAAGAVAYASIPGPDGIIHGCYKTSNPATGSVIVIDHTASCPSGFAPLNWNQTGPQGPAGPEGPAGPAATSVTETRVRHYDPPTTGSVETVTCPTGTHAINGGVAQSFPAEGWFRSPQGFTEGDAYTNPSGKENPANPEGPPYLALPRPVDNDAGWRMAITVTLPTVTTNSGVVTYGLGVTLYAICL